MRGRKKNKRKDHKENITRLFEQDENFYFIVGYRSGGRMKGTWTWLILNQWLKIKSCKELMLLVSYVKNSAFPQPLAEDEEEKHLRLWRREISIRGIC